MRAVAPSPAGLGPLVTVGTGSNGPRSMVLTWSEAMAAGYSNHYVRWQLESGRWQLVHPGVFYVFSGPIPRGALLRAALLHAGNGAVLDGPTAGSLHGLGGFDDNRPIHVR